MTIILPGGSGQIGNILARHFRSRLHGEVAVDIERTGRVPDGIHLRNGEIAFSEAGGDLDDVRAFLSAEQA